MPTQLVCHWVRGRKGRNSLTTGLYDSKVGCQQVFEIDQGANSAHLDLFGGGSRFPEKIEALY